MRLLSNLIKSNAIYFSKDEKRVIDSNHRLDLYEFQSEIPSDQKSQINDEFVEGIQAESAYVMEEENQESTEEILMKAKEEADKIIEEAIKKANLEKEIIFKEAKEEGYSEGKLKSQEELEKQKEELNEKGDSLEKDYQEKLKEIEPEVVQLMIDYLYKLTGVVIEEHEEVICHLIHQGISGSEDSKDYIIKVSKEDLKIVESKKEELFSILKSGSNLEIIEDNNLDRNECLLETNHRIIDCSLDVQLKNLITDLKILACI